MALAEAIRIVPLEARFYGVRLPFGDRVPLPHLRKVDEGERHTASHELGHATIAKALGYSARIDLNRRGSVLASTHISGDPSDDGFRLVAAGGMIATFDGTAHGFGSDEFKVDGIPGTMSKTKILATAGGIIEKSCSDVEVRKMAAEITVCLGGATDSMLPYIFKRAEMEVAILRGQIVESVFVPEEIEQEEIPKTESIIPKEGTSIIENHGDGLVIIRTNEKVLIPCRLCLGVEDHAPDCPTRQEQKPNGKKEEQETVQKPKPMTRREILFNPIRQIPIVVFPGPATASQPLKKAA